MQTYDTLVNENGLFLLMEYGQYSLWDLVQDKDSIFRKRESGRKGGGGGGGGGEEEGEEEG